MSMSCVNVLLIISSNILLCYCKCDSQDSSLDNTELVMAFMIHRHGDITPTEKSVKYCTDPVKVRRLTKKYGYGQLTNLGKRRSYKLGKFIRRRYGGLLSAQYNKSEIYLRSTDSTRTKMTLLTALAAIYPPVKDDWSEDINWTPVPYTTLPLIQDFILPTVNCPVFERHYKKTMKDPVPKIAKKYKTLLNYLSDVLGTNITKKPVTSHAVYNALISQIHLGVPVDKTTERMLPELEEAAAESLHILYGNDKYIALKAGVLLKEFFDKADRIISGEDIPRVQVYSAHDTNVYGFMETTRITPRLRVPKYQSLYSLELRAPLKTGRYIVVPVYFKEPGIDAINLQVEECDGFCDLDRFRNLTAKFQLDTNEWKALCEFREDYNFDSSAFD